MSESEEGDLWKQMDAGFQRVLEDDKEFATHAALPRAELEAHMRDAHRVTARTELVAIPEGGWPKQLRDSGAKPGPISGGGQK